jgi:photosystem II stability/assembly factor-like uncharacterized protein
VTDPIFHLAFVDEQNGWASGRAGLVLHTADGGKGWQRQPTPTDKHLLAIDFLDAQRGAAVGDWGVVLTTEDGGASWIDHSLTEDLVLYGVRVVAPGELWVVGEAGAVLHSTDGGSNWARCQGCGDKSLFAVDFDGREHGIAVGLDGEILVTADGNNWKVAANQVGRALYAVRLRGGEAWAVGDAGTVLRSTDGGGSWSALPVSEDVKLSWLHGVSFIGGQTVVVGAGGLVLSPGSDREAHS